jgi:hypothetical protein
MKLEKIASHDEREFSLEEKRVLETYFDTKIAS